MRCVGSIKRFASKLQRDSLSNGERPEQPGIQIDGAGAIENIEAGSAKPDLGDLRKGRRVVERLSGTDATQLLHGGKHLIGALSTARCIERSTRRSNIEWLPCIHAEQRIDLPSTEEGRYSSAIPEAFPAAKR